MMRQSTIALDGAAGSGKSTIGHLLAVEMGYAFVDAGTIYRAIARRVLASHCNVDSEESVNGMMSNLALECKIERSGLRIITIQGKELESENLYTEEINRVVPVVAAYPSVRLVVRSIQREIAQGGKVVMAGRDIGSVVLPNADVKVFLETSFEERVRRRYASLKNSMPSVTEDGIRKDLERRDMLDSIRSESPMRVPQDAIVIHTDGVEPIEVVVRILDLFDEPHFARRD